jgi:signal transduction histidine kinase
VSLVVACLPWTAAFAGALSAAAERRRLARRTELVARACHELRGPLTAARLGVSLAAAGPGAPEGPLAAVDQELRRAGLALADLAAAPRGARANDRWEVVSVGALLRRAVVAWAPVAQRAGARVRLRACPLGAAVRGDPVRLAQAVGNLLANAIEHGGGTIEVCARPGAEGGVRIEVCDGGSGLAAPVAELARAARAGRGERGRGLAIAADIARRHGGRLAAAPSGRGARLVLELPAAAEASLARGRKGPHP